MWTRRHLIRAGVAGATLASPRSFAYSDNGRWATRLASDYLNSTGQDSIAPAARALSDAPEGPQTWYARGMVMRASGDHQASLEAFRHSLTYDPIDYKAKGQIGMTLINLGRPAEGVELLTEALRTSDWSRAGVYAFNLGRAHYFAKDYSSAIPWFWRAFQTRPELRFILPYLSSSLALDGSPKVASRMLPAHLTLAAIIDDESRNPTGSPMMAEARERLHDSLSNLGMPS